MRGPGTPPPCAPTSSPPRRWTLLVVGGLLAAIALDQARGEERRGRVEAVEGDEIVIDLGDGEGAAIGIVGAVRRGDRVIAHVTLTEVRAASARGRLAETRGRVEVGDEVRLLAPGDGAGSPATAAPPRAPPPAPLAPARPPAPAAGPETATPDAAGAPAPASIGAGAPGTPAGPGLPPPPLPAEEVLRRLRAAPRALRAPPSPTGSTTAPDPAAIGARPATGAGADAPGRVGASGARPAPAAPRAPPENVLAGSARLAYDAMLDRDGLTDFTRHGPRADLAFTLSRIGGEDLTLRFRGRLRAIFADEQGNRTGGEIDTQALLDEASLEWRPRAAPIRLSIGRVGLYDVATVGAVDGARVAVLLGPAEVGAFGGLDPRPDLSDRGRTKIGGYVRLATPPAEHLSVDATLAFARTTTPDGAVDRHLVAADARLRLSPWLTVYARTEVDLYGATENPAERGGVVLTDIYAYASLRPFPDLDLGVSFDRRVPFLGVEALDDLPLEAREDVAARTDDPLTTLRLDARLRLPRAWWVRGAVDLRRGGSAQTTVTGAVGWDAVFDREVWASVEGRAWTGDLVEGSGARLRVGAPIYGPLEADLSYEVTFDRYEDSLDEVVRHAIGLDAFLYLDRAVSLSLSLGYETGDDIDSAYARIDLIWRF